MAHSLSEDERTVRVLVAARHLTISALVAEHLQAFCAISCSGADVQRRHLGPGVVEERQALLLPDVTEAFDCFLNQHPEVQISFEDFRRSLPWNVLVAVQSHSQWQPAAPPASEIAVGTGRDTSSDSEEDVMRADGYPPPLTQAPN